MMGKPTIIKEGSTREAVIRIPDALDMTDYDASLVVFREVGGPVILAYSTAEGTMQKAGQLLHFTFRPADTRGKAGKFHFELQIKNGDELIHIFDSQPIEIEKTTHARFTP